MVSHHYMIITFDHILSNIGMIIGNIPPMTMPTVIGLLMDQLGMLLNQQ